MVMEVSLTLARPNTPALYLQEIVIVIVIVIVIIIVISDVDKRSCEEVVARYSRVATGASRSLDIYGVTNGAIQECSFNNHW